jgi:hypothetical protein
MSKTFGPSEYIGAGSANIRTPTTAAPGVGYSLTETGSNQLGWSAPVFVTGDQTITGKKEFYGTSATVDINTGENSTTAALRFSHRDSLWGDTQRKTAILAPPVGGFGISGGLYFAFNTANDNSNATISDSVFSVTNTGDVTLTSGKIKFNSAFGSDCIRMNIDGTQAHDFVISANTITVDYGSMLLRNNWGAISLDGATGIFLNSNLSSQRVYLNNADTYFVRPSAGVFGHYGDGGVVIRNSADSAYAPIAASDATLSGNVTLKPAASVTPANNGELTFQATSNTQLTFKYKGSDGTVRSGGITLS